MSNKIYTDILITDDCFYLYETTEQKKSAQELLNLIEKIVQENITWANPPEGLNPIQFPENLRQRALSIHNAFEYKAANLSPVIYALSNIAYEIMCIKKTYNHIENIVFKLPVLNLPEELIFAISDYLTLSDVVQLSRVNHNGHSLACKMITARAKKIFGLLKEINNFEITNEYLNSLHRGLKILLKECSELEPFVDNHSGWILSTIKFESSFEKIKTVVSTNSNQGLVAQLKRALPQYAEKGYIDVVKLLLSFGIPPDSKDAHGRTALISAKQQLPMIQALLDKGADPNQTHQGESPLWKHLNDADITDLLCKKKANVEHIKDGKHPLHETAERGWQASTKVLIQHNAEPNSKNRNFDTPLHVVKTDKDLISLLLEAGANPNLPDQHGIYPLCHFIDNPEILKLLCKKGAKAELCYPLHLAIKKGLVETVRVLLSEKINPDGLDKDLQPPISYAKDPMMIRLLCQFDANINLQHEQTKSTALHLAAKDKDEERVQILLECGANPLLKDMFGNYPMHYCMKIGKISEMLLLYKALYES